MLRFASLLLLFAAAMAHADDEYEVRTYGSLLRTCFVEAEGADAKAQCVGAMSSACMETEDGGYTTLGMSRCAYGETLVWDEFLNAEYRTTRRMLAEMDEDEAEGFPEFANRVESLVKAQRAWIIFRDRSCELEYALWGAGSMRHIAGTNCGLELTADRTIDLIRMREVFQ